MTTCTMANPKSHDGITECLEDTVQLLAVHQLLLSE